MPGNEKHLAPISSEQMPGRTRPDMSLLKGWNQIAAFLGQPVAVAQRWARDGMPVRREGRYMVASSEELNRWLSVESGVSSVRVATESTDLMTELKRGLSAMRHKGQERRRAS